MIKKLFVSVLLLIPLTISAQSNAIRNWYCTPPTSGSTPVGYQWQMSSSSNPWIDLASTQAESISINVNANVSYRIRVRAVDVDNHLGIWSQASSSDIYNTPGQCGVPVWR